MSKGYNPLRWDCQARGCFNQKKRPKIELFHDCFPGRINFGDVDARVEFKSHFLELEWKAARGPINTGQRIAFERLTRCAPVTVLVVVGNAETMEVDAVARFHDGTFTDFADSSFEDIRARIRGWVEWVNGSR